MPASVDLSYRDGDESFETIRRHWNNAACIAHKLSSRSEPNDPQSRLIDELIDLFDRGAVYAIARSIYLSPDLEDDAASRSARAFVRMGPTLCRGLIDADTIETRVKIGTDRHYHEIQTALSPTWLRKGLRTLMDSASSSEEEEFTRSMFIVLFTELRVRATGYMSDIPDLKFQHIPDIIAGSLRYVTPFLYGPELPTHLRRSILQRLYVDTRIPLQNFIHALYRGNMTLFHDLLGVAIGCLGETLAQVGENNPARIAHSIERAGHAMSLPPEHILFLKNAYACSRISQCETPGTIESMYSFERRMRERTNISDETISFCFSGFTDADPFPFSILSEASSPGAIILRFRN